MSREHDPGHPATRPTIKEMPSQTGLDDFAAQDETNPERTPPPFAEHDTAEEGGGEPAGAPVGQFHAHGLEVSMVHERGKSARPGQWRAFEVWTAKSIYAIDGQMTCFGVMDRVSGRADERHAFLGARLMGGERKVEGAMSFSHPLPTPGSEAVFQIKSATRGRYGHTSLVEKVVLRIRVTHAVMDSGDTLWEEITHTFRPPGP
jgi:hypothetical protein